MTHFYRAFRRTGGKNWKRVAGVPPMHYITHGTSMVLSVTDARATSVSCLGFEDHHCDGIFGEGANSWNNPFSNETALMRTSDGGMLRINEFRRLGWKGLTSVQMSLIGTKGSFEEQADSQVWSTIFPEETTNLNKILKYVSANELMSNEHAVLNEDGRVRDLRVERDVLKELYSGVSQVHPVDRLPEEFARLHNGHMGSHQFLVDDFVKAVVTNSPPPNHVWAAARYCAPGLVAHQSALREGEQLESPDFGNPPGSWEHLDPYFFGNR